jgi:hypothetical protein
MSDVIKYIVIGESLKEGRIEDVSACNMYSEAVEDAESFASRSPADDALITIYECKVLSVYSGRMPPLTQEVPPV